jgi:ribosomal protein S18 acetylase RimI-like enzyme
MSDNTPALAFYEKNGYVRDAISPDEQSCTYAILSKKLGISISVAGA